MSVAANIAHSYVPPTGAPAHWAPNVGAVGAAMFWPIALFVTLEILTRVPWPTGSRWVWLRWAGLPPVAVVAAVVSYRHMSGLLTWYGEDRVTSTIGPLAVDGLMLVATGALIATGAGRRTSTPPDPEPFPARAGVIEREVERGPREPVTVVIPEWAAREALPSSPTSPWAEPPTGQATDGQAPNPPTDEPAHLPPVKVGAQPPMPNPPSEPPTPVGDLPPAPKADPPKAPTPPTEAVGTDGLTDLQRQRLADLDREFPDEIPGRTKVMAHMKAKGYTGWSSNDPAKLLIDTLKARRTLVGAN